MRCRVANHNELRSHAPDAVFEKETRSLLDDLEAEKETHVKVSLEQRRGK